MERPMIIPAILASRERIVHAISTASGLPLSDRARLHHQVWMVVDRLEHGRSSSATARAELTALEAGLAALLSADTGRAT